MKPNLAILAAFVGFVGACSSGSSKATDDAATSSGGSEASGGHASSTGGAATGASTGGASSASGGSNATGGAQGQSGSSGVDASADCVKFCDCMNMNCADKVFPGGCLSACAEQTTWDLPCRQNMCKLVPDQPTNDHCTHAFGTSECN
jgi:hypothetical protein